MKHVVKVLLLVIVMAMFTACTKAETGNDNDSKEKNNQLTPVPTIEATASDENNGVKTDNQDTTGEADTEKPEDKIDINIAALKGPTAIGMVKLMEDASNNETTNNYKFTIAGAADEISAGLIKGDFDIAAIPCNLASVLYNKTEGKIKLAGINTLGVLYIIETGETIHSIDDLAGKTIYSTGLGTTPQYTLNYILSSHGIDPEKDVTIEYKSEPTEVAALLSNADNAIAMLPQPYVTTVMMNNNKVRIALDIEKEWESVSQDESSVVTGVVVVRSDFLEKNKDAVDAFMSEYTTSTAFANEKEEEVSALAEKFDLFKAAVMKQAIPNCNITMLQGDQMKKQVQGYLTVLYDQNPQSVGGKLPGDDFYYIP